MDVDWDEKDKKSCICLSTLGVTIVNECTHFHTYLWHVLALIANVQHWIIHHPSIFIHVSQHCISKLE